VTHLFVCDQSDFSLLKRIGETGGRLFDVIVDNGGHTRKQQINYLIGLWPFVRNSGGFYAIEDIFTSFLPNFNDKANESTIDLIFMLIILLNNPSGAGFPPPFVYPNFTISEDAGRISKDIMSVNCFERACALIKKDIFLTQCFGSNKI
jgi:hypothetical protein